MRIASAATLALGAQLLTALPATAEIASQPPVDRAYLSFPCPTRIPGATLHAGTYLFVITASAGGQSLIDVYTADADSRRVARFLGVESRGTRPPQAASGACPAIAAPRRGWFDAVDASGLEFVYGREEAAALARTTGARLPFSVLPVGDRDLVGAYPVAGLGVLEPVLLIGAGSLVALPSERSRLGLLIAKTGASFGPADHLRAARLILAERAAHATDERILLQQLGHMLDALQRAARGRDAALTDRLGHGLVSTLTNLAPPTHELARRGILPPPRDFVLLLEQLGAHVRAFLRARATP